MRKRRSDFGSLLSGLAVALVLLDGEDVQVCVGWGFCGCSGPGGLLIAIVHFNTPELDVWTFIAPEIRSDGEEIRQRKSAERTWVVE